MEILQIIPLFALTVYFLYLSYYYAVPMLCLRILMIIACWKYRCTRIQFTEEKISVTVPEGRTVYVLEQPLGVELTSRFFVMSSCSVMKKILKEIRHRRLSAEGDE